jgi:hypothetical protein
VLKSRVDRAEIALKKYVPPVIPIPKHQSQPEALDKLLGFTREAIRVEANLIINRIIYEEAKAGKVKQLPEGFIESNIDSSIPLADRLNTDYEMKVRYEKIIKSQIEKMRLEDNGVPESIIQYKVLKQNLETARSMYEELIRKAQRSGIELGSELKDGKNAL